jgi:peptidoglycan/xylan/chitin deacetylase (PgdA/CDA1 family)
LVFTGHEFAEGGNFIANTLQQQKTNASFFFTGSFYRNPQFWPVIRQLKKDSQYLGAHSDDHLLYCDWEDRKKLLVTKDQFMIDLLNNYGQMTMFKIEKEDAPFFLPPYEWYNDSISKWSKEMGIQLINYTPGTLSHADYTTLKDKNYRSSETIYNSIINYEQSKPAGLNGFILLMHIGAGPDRTDKFYSRLPNLIKYLKQKGYQFQTVDKLFKAD